MTSDELIEKLPGDLQPWGRLWLPVLLRWGEDKLAEFIMGAAGMPWDAAYERIVQSMTAEEKVAELKIRRESLQRLNRENLRVYSSSWFCPISISSFEIQPPPKALYNRT